MGFFKETQGAHTQMGAQLSDLEYKFGYLAR